MDFYPNLKEKREFALTRQSGFRRTVLGLYAPKGRFFISPPMYTVLLLLASNVFMTFAWYGHLRFRESPLWIVILASWGIAFFEYCLQVPANRIGSYQFAAAQLKVMQEVITLLVFSVFSILYLREALRWNHAVSFLFLLGAVFFAFKK